MAAPQHFSDDAFIFGGSTAEPIAPVIFELWCKTKIFSKIYKSSYNTT